MCFVFLSFSEMPGERRSPGAGPAERSAADECGGRKDVLYFHCVFCVFVVLRDAR